MSLLIKVIRAVTWNFVSRASNQLLQIAFLIVLARLLDPSQFGLVGMLIVFTGFAQALADCGLGSALIHKQETKEHHYSTVFWIQLAVGISLTILFFVAAPLIAEFYSVPILESLTRLVSCIFLLQAAGNIQSTLLIKEFHFRTLSIISITATAFSGTAAIVLALHSYGAWALAWQFLVFNVITTGLLWMQSKWRPRLVFDTQAALELGRYGIYLMASGSVNYWLRNLDNLLVGKFLGAHQLGIYGRAYQLMMFPVLNIASVVGQVMFPALAQIQNDIPRFKRSFTNAICLIALIAFPLMAGMAILAEPFVLVVFGPKWVEVIPVLKILSCVGLFQSIVHPVGWIFNALGKTKGLFQLAIYLAPAFVIAMAIGLRFGILGVAAAYAAWALLDGIISLYVAGKLIDLTVGRFLLSVAKIGLMTAIMGIVVFSLDLTLLPTWSPVARLVAGVSVGAGSYLALCLILKDETFAQLTWLIFSLFDRSSTVA